VRVVRQLTKQCERARECASLRLDGELSEFEQALLTAHLARCEPCRSFASELDAITTGLRNAPLEPLEQPVALPARRRISRRPAEIAAAAALLVTALGITGAVRTIEGSNPSLTFSAPPGVSNAVESREFSDIRRAMIRREILRDIRATAPGGLNLRQS
jgi:predicted anti-sigma-YlaC factor YlaD